MCVIPNSIEFLDLLFLIAPCIVYFCGAQLINIVWYQRRIYALDDT